MGIQNVHESRRGEEVNEFVAGRSCVRGRGGEGRGGVEVERTNTGGIYAKPGGTPKPRVWLPVR